MVGVTFDESSFVNKIVDSVIPREIVDFLGKVHYQNSFFFLNNWSFVHLGAGVLFYFVLSWVFPKWSLKKKILMWVVLDFLYEVVEFILGSGGHPLFVEEVVDIVWDLIFTIGAFILTGWLVEKKNKRIK